MNSRKLFLITIVTSITAAPLSAFIFDTANDHDIMNYKYGDECFQNQTVMDTVNEFKRNFDIIKVLSRREVRSVRRRGFETVFADVCEAKRNVARTMTDCIQPTADFCVGDEKVRKEFVLNTLMILQTTLDYICGMNQSVFEDIYDLSCEECLTANMQQLQLCQRNSFDLYFWEQVPEKLPTITHLINGAVCNFDFDKMLNCFVSSSTARLCPDGAIQLLAYQFDVVKRNSLCFKTKDVSDIIDSSSEDVSVVI